MENRTQIKDLIYELVHVVGSFWLKVAETKVNKTGFTLFINNLKG